MTWRPGSLWGLSCKTNSFHGLASGLGSCFKKCKESHFFCKHPVLHFLISILIVFAAPFLALELLCLGCRKSDLVHIFSVEFQSTQSSVCTTCFAVAFLEYSYFSLSGFSEASLGVDCGPPSMWLVGTPLVSCCQVDGQ